MAGIRVPAQTLEKIILLCDSIIDAEELDVLVDDAIDFDLPKKIKQMIDAAKQQQAAEAEAVTNEQIKKIMIDASIAVRPDLKPLMLANCDWKIDYAFMRALIDRVRTTNITGLEGGSQ